MFTLLAGAFASVATLFGGWFGAHNASTTPMHMPMASSTEMHDHMASTTPWGMGSTTPGHMGSTTMDHGMMGMGPGIMGKILSINGNTLSVSGKANINAATTIYSVDASSAKILGKSGANTISGLKIGDNIIVSGTVSGTSVTAKIIIDGPMGMMPGMPMQGTHPTPGIPPHPTAGN